MNLKWKKKSPKAATFESEIEATEALEVENQEEDCMLCLEPFHRSDHQIPMRCPLDGCPFNYCSQCVWNLLLASSQPYQEASDGSKQLKISLQCPQCRTKYPHKQVVQDVLLLRQAFRLQPLFFDTGSQTALPPCESSQKASDLSGKQDFAEQVTWDQLRESWQRVNHYLKNRSNPQEGFEVSTITERRDMIPRLPEQWKEHLHEDTIDTAKENNNNGFGRGQANYDLVDPTLFQGMDETMTLSEQEFLSKLLVSGSVPNLMQAAQILNGMLQLMLQGGLKARQTTSMNISGIAAFDGAASQYPTKRSNPRMLATSTNLLYPDVATAVLRQRFPLPLHMPRVMFVPVYHPDRRGVPVDVKNHEWGLKITSVKGSVGQQGIRKGDVITHIEEEPCNTSTPIDFKNYMRALFETNYKNGVTDAAVLMVVNAHPDTATKLQARSYEIIDFLTRQKDSRMAAAATS